METGKFWRLFGVVLGVMVLAAGCSSSGGGGGSTPVSLGYTTYSEPGSDLVLQISDTLEVLQEEIEDIYYYAGQVEHCYTTNRETIDIVLAEACIDYDMLYLYPEYFPQNLDGILNVSSYVQYMRRNDPFTFYFSPDDFEEVMTFLSGNSAFIGFTVYCDGQTVTTETPLIIDSIDPYTRAWIDDFQAGDRILEINGISIGGMDVYSAVSLLPTNEEEDAEITVERDGAEITIFTAAEENIGLLLYDDIGYLSVRSFTEKTGDEVRLDYERLQMESGGKIDKLILDLRGDGGGSHAGMLMLADYLIDLDNGSYPIISTYGPAYEDETEYLGDQNDFNIGGYDETNFVLLIDGNSASASEVVAAALKYYDTAFLLGDTTYGKGIGQSVAELIDGSGVVIPSIHLLPPSGVSYHGIGIHPDHYLTVQPTSFYDDPVLDAAVEYLNTGSITITASIQIAPDSRLSVSEQRLDPLQEDLLKKDRSGNFF